MAFDPMDLDPASVVTHRRPSGSSRSLSRHCGCRVTTAASSAMVCSYCQGSDHNITTCFQKYADQYSEVRKDISKLGAALDNIEASRRNIQECMDRAFQKLDGLEKKLRELDQDGKIRRDSAAEGGGYRLDAMRKISDNQCPASSHGVNAGFQPRIAVS